MSQNFQTKTPQKLTKISAQKQEYKNYLQKIAKKLQKSEKSDQKVQNFGRRNDSQYSPSESRQVKSYLDTHQEEEKSQTEKVHEQDKKHSKPRL